MARRELDPRLREIELRRERVRCGWVRGCRGSLAG
jgi:hypothetical protein